jgi:glycosyltransferase involved in cell wall biosynthesis
MVSKEGKMTESDLVTVVIPCYNQASFLSEAIESVRRQTHARWEVIVVDDGSTDNTAAVAARYAGVRLLRQANRGLSGARNSGMAAARGAYLVFLDADDRLLPQALEHGLRCLAEHPEAAFAYGKYLIVYADGTQPSHWWPRVEQDYYMHLLKVNYIGMHAAVMYRRTVFEAVGGFDERLAACEDYDLYFRAARRFPICYHSEAVAEYRQHGSNMTRNSALMLKTALDVLNSQRKYVKGNPRYEEALQAGVRFWQGLYGEGLLEDVITQLHQRDDWRRTLRGLYVLVSYYPQGILNRVKRKFVVLFGKATTKRREMDSR